MEEVNLKSSMNDIINRAKSLGINIYTQEGNIKKKPQLLTEIANGSVEEKKKREEQEYYNKIDNLKLFNDVKEATEYQKAMNISDDDVCNLIYQDAVKSVEDLKPIEQFIKLKSTRYILVLIMGYSYQEEIIGDKNDILNQLVYIEMMKFQNSPNVFQKLNISFDELQDNIYKYHSSQWGYIKRGGYTSLNTYYYDDVANTNQSDKHGKTGYIIVPYK